MAILARDMSTVSTFTSVPTFLFKPIILSAFFSRSTTALVPSLCWLVSSSRRSLGRMRRRLTSPIFPSYLDRALMGANTSWERAWGKEA